MRMGQAPGASKGRKTVYESWQEILVNIYLPCHADKSRWCKKLSLVTALHHGTGPRSKFFLAVKGEVQSFSWVCWVSAAFGSKESECQDSTFWGGIFCSPLGDTKQSVHSIPYTENRQQCWHPPPPNAIHALGVKIWICWGGHIPSTAFIFLDSLFHTTILLRADTKNNDSNKTFTLLVSKN